jgi:hypothetical protein
LERRGMPSGVTLGLNALARANTIDFPSGVHVPSQCTYSVLSAPGSIDGLSLVGVELTRADATQGRLQDRRQGPVQFAITRPSGLESFHVDHLAPVAG